MTKKHRTEKSTLSGSTHRQRQKARKPNLTWLWISLSVVVVVVVVAAVAYWLLGPKSSLPNKISPAQAYQKYQQGAFFLDVRSQAEWDQMHIAKSTLIPLDELQSRLGELPRDRDIVVVCLSGHRSEEGMNILQEAGFSRAACMTGGLTAWKEAGYPLEGSAP
jgi:rhodanese-related sulfurtransferase